MENNFNDKNIFKNLKTFTGFKGKGTSCETLATYEASEGYYISCTGELWSLKNPNKPRMLGNVSATGYVECEIRLKDRSARSVKIHRLVAEYWVEGFNPEEGKIIVNHIDENKQNNHPNNLEWCTPRHNSNHGTRNERLSKSVKDLHKTPEYKAKHSKSLKDFHKINAGYNRDSLNKALKSSNAVNSKPVAMFYKDSKVYKAFSSLAKAAQYSGVDPSTVSDWVKRKKPSRCGKFIWDYYKLEDSTT